MGHVLPKDKLARTISEAALDPSKWIEVCDEIAMLVGGCGSVVFPTPGEHARLGLPHSAALEASFDRYIDGQWYRKDLRFGGLGAMRKKGYFTDADYISYGDVAKSDYYQDFLRPVNLQWFLGIGIEAGKDSWVLSIQQQLGREPFSESEIKTALSYREHLCNSAMISKRLGFARIEGASSILEQHGLSAIALDANENVLHVTPSAERHFHDGLRVSRGKLIARHSLDEIALARLINRVCDRDLFDSSRHAVVRRSDGKPPLVVYGCRLPDVGCDIFQPAIALLVISDPEHQHGISPDLFVDYYGMTRAEAKLAISLYLGVTLEQYAVMHGISPVTARNQLQVLLRKTSTHRQIDLIAALNRIIPRR